MRTILSALLLLSALSLVGCGGPSGPAKPEDTPVLTDQEVKDRMTQNVPPAAKKMYEQYQKGQGGQRPR